jgi:hypothetical protein
VETQSERKPQNVFSYMSLRITFIGSTKFLCFPAATGRRLSFSGHNLEKAPTPKLSGYNQKEATPPSFSGYNLREDPTPQFFGYNQKEDTTPYVLRLQSKGGYNHMSLPRPTALK